MGVTTDGAGRLRGVGRAGADRRRQRASGRAEDGRTSGRRAPADGGGRSGRGPDRGAQGPVDLMIVNVSSRASSTACGSSPRCARPRRPRNLPILAIVDQADRPRLVKALELGVNDILSASGRPGRAGGADADPDQAQALHRLPEAEAGLQPGDGGHRRPDGAAQPPLHGRAAAGLMNRAPGRAASPSRCWCWTSTTSNWSTTASATTPATRCCASSRCGWRPMCAPSTCRAVWAARSSWWSCRAPGMEDAVRIADRIRRDVSASQPFPIMGGAGTC
jgi:two-component system cell cycle response regulator